MSVSVIQFKIVQRVFSKESFKRFDWIWGGEGAVTRTPRERSVGRVSGTDGAGTKPAWGEGGHTHTLCCQGSHRLHTA